MMKPSVAAKTSPAVNPDRTSGGKEHFEVVDSLRGSAAFLIVIFHLFIPLAGTLLLALYVTRTWQSISSSQSHSTTSFLSKVFVQLSSVELTGTTHQKNAGGSS